MTLSGDDLARVQRIAQATVREMLRNQDRGQGGLVLPLPVTRQATVGGVSEPGTQVVIRADGDVESVAALNATECKLVGGDRVLVTWMAPQGVYVTATLGGSGGPHDWTPGLTGPSADGTGQTGGGVYYKNGHTVSARGWWLMGGGQIGSAAEISGLPYRVAPWSVFWARGWALLIDSNGLRFPADWIVSAGNQGGQLFSHYTDVSPGHARHAAVTATSPFTWVAGDYIYVEITYQTDQ